ncbi:hypothetical protein KGQ64_12730 [bacterium]|nr:hypothetical protein [bacterium]
MRAAPIRPVEAVAATSVGIAVLLALVGPATAAFAAARGAGRKATAVRVTGASVEIRGEVVDLDCYLRDGSRGAGHKSCATACVAHGGSLAILEDDSGRLFPLAGDKVASDPSKPVRELVARHVLVRGRLWERNRGRVLVVDQVEALDAAP